MLGVGALIAVVGLAYLAWSWPEAPSAPLPDLAISRLTATGKASLAAISPDGRYVVHVVSDNQHSLWLRQTALASDVQIVPPGPQRYLGVAISPDGNYAYFTRGDDGVVFSLYRVPILGGTPERLIRDVDSQVTFSPDGDRVAFIRGLPDIAELHLLVAPADGSDEPAILAKSSLGAVSFSQWIAWSPDGRHIAVPVGGISGMGSSDPVRIALVNASTGELRELTSALWGTVTGVAWLDADALVVSGAEISKLNPQLWRVGMDGTVRRLTNDLASYLGVAASSGGTSIISIHGDTSSTISVTGVGGAGPLVPVTSGRDRHDGQYGLTWTHGGRLIFNAAESGRMDLWMSDADGAHAARLTSNDLIESFPVVGPDDRAVFFRAGTNGIVRLSLETGETTALTSNGMDVVGRVLEDGALLISRFDGWYRARADGSDQVKIAESGWAGVVSRDNRLVAGLTNRISGRYQIGIIPLDGTPPTQAFDIVNIPPLLGWAPLGEAVTYLETRHGPHSLWTQPLDGNPPKPLLDPGGDRIFNFAWSDGGRLAVAHGSASTDVVLFTGVSDSTARRN